MDANRIFTLAASLLFLVGCPASDDSDETTTTVAGTESATTDPTTSTTAPPTESAEGSTGGGMMCDGSSNVQIQMCIDMGLAMGQCEEVIQCACQNCVCQLQACEANPGCTAIRACAQETGCTDIMCYDPSTCMMVIDDNGGPTGESASLALSLSNCIDAVPCPIQCGGETGSTSRGEGSTGDDSTGGGSTGG